MAIAHARGREHREIAEAVAESVSFREPSGKRLGLMKGEARAGARLGIAFVVKKRFDAGKFAGERKRGRVGQELGREKLRKFSA